MAASIHVKPKGSWKKVKIDFSLLSKNDLDSLASFEELTDYELVKDEIISTTKRLKKVVNVGVGGQGRNHVQYQNILFKICVY